MKISKLSKKILKYMVEEYVSSNIEWFSFDTIKTKFSEQSDEHLNNAIYYLQDNKFVSVISADDVAYMTKLLPYGICHHQEDTILKRCYSVLKELRNLLP